MARVPETIGTLQDDGTTIVGTDGASGAAATGQPGRYGSGFFVQPVALRREGAVELVFRVTRPPRRLFALPFALRPQRQTGQTSDDKASNYASQASREASTFPL